MPFGISEPPHLLTECCEQRVRKFPTWCKDADARRPTRQLRPCRQWPRGRRAAEQRDELAALHRCSHSITSSARASNFQNGRFLSSQWFPDRATSAQTNSRAPSVVLNQIDDLWSPSTFHLARDRQSSCRILACHQVAHAKLRLSCGAHPR